MTKSQAQHYVVGSGLGRFRIHHFQHVCLTRSKTISEAAMADCQRANRKTNYTVIAMGAALMVYLVTLFR